MGKKLCVTNLRLADVSEGFSHLPSKHEENVNYYHGVDCSRKGGLLITNDMYVAFCR